MRLIINKQLILELSPASSLKVTFNASQPAPSLEPLSSG
jgi:hypothetical protein